MNKLTKIAVASGTAIVLIVGLIASGVCGGPSDGELIDQALTESVAASREGRPGGVLEYLSKNFSVNDEQFGTRDIAKTIRDLKPNVELESRKPLIAGDSATITSPVRLSVSLPPVSYTISQVTLSFSKEESRKWLIFPAKQWRLTKVEIPAEVVEEVRGQFSGGM